MPNDSTAHRRKFRPQPLGRRDVLKVGALGLSGLLLPDLWKLRAAAGERSPLTPDTSVVWLWLPGGASHIEFFDPKMDAPSDYRSTVGALPTALPGIHFGGLFPKLAALADRIAVVRSFGHTQPDHLAATHFVMTGADVPVGTTVQRNPSLGSITSKVRGASHHRSGLPNYIRLTHSLGMDFDGPVWLGAAHAPLDVWREETRQNMSLRFDTEHLAHRRKLLSALDRYERLLHAGSRTGHLDGLEQQAFELILGQARDAFDVSAEDPHVRARYGPFLGEYLLQARRLCEAGCGFVTIQYRNAPGVRHVPYAWDMHVDKQPGDPLPLGAQLPYVVPMLDQAVSAFVEDIIERGLDRKILLVLTSDFGRTPKLNHKGGRDHWAPLGPLVLAGGGLRMGQVVGETSSKAEYPVTRPIPPSDLLATIFHVLGIDPEVQFTDYAGRPQYLLPDGAQPIAELI